MSLNKCYCLALAVSVTALPTGHCGEVMHKDVESSIRAGDHPKVVADTFNGNIEVKAGKADTIQVRVRKEAKGRTKEDSEALLGSIQVTIQEEKGIVRILAKCNDSDRRGEREANVFITLPPSASVELSSNNGQVNVNGLEKGSATVRVRNGAILVERCKASRFDLLTNNGRVEVSATDAQLTARVNNGAVQFRGSLSLAEHTLACDNGRVTLELPADTKFGIDARCGIGNVKVSQTLSKVDHKKPGRLSGKVGDSTTRQLRITTGCGDIEIGAAEKR